MAVDESEDKVVPEKKSGNTNLIMIIGVVLIVISLALSVVSLLTIMGINQKIENPEGVDEAEVDTSIIPLSEITTFEFEDQFILSYDDLDTDGTNTVLFDLSVGMHNTEKDFADIQTTISSSENILRSDVGAKLKRNKYEDFKSAEGMDMLREELKLYFQERLESETVIDVYFSDMLYSEK